MPCRQDKVNIAHTIVEYFNSRRGSYSWSFCEDYIPIVGFGYFRSGSVKAGGVEKK